MPDRVNSFTIFDNFVSGKPSRKEAVYILVRDALNFAVADKMCVIQCVALVRTLGWDCYEFPLDLKYNHAFTAWRVREFCFAFPSDFIPDADFRQAGNFIAFRIRFHTLFSFRFRESGQCILDMRHANGLYDSIPSDFPGLLTRFR